MIIYSGTQAASKNPQNDADIWQLNIGGFGRLGPASEFLRQILRAYDHLGFEIYALRDNRHFNYDATAIQDLEDEPERMAVRGKHPGKHYEFCVVLPNDEVESEIAGGRQLENEEKDAVGEDGVEDGYDGDLAGQEDVGGQYVHSGVPDDGESEFDKIESFQATNNTAKRVKVCSRRIRSEKNDNQAGLLPLPEVTCLEAWRQATYDELADSETESETESEESEESDDEL